MLIQHHPLIFGIGIDILSHWLIINNMELLLLAPSRSLDIFQLLNGSIKIEIFLADRWQEFTLLLLVSLSPSHHLAKIY